MWAGFSTDSINKKSEKKYFDFDMRRTLNQV